MKTIVLMLEIAIGLSAMMLGWGLDEACIY